jgi:hypothetical protein
VRYVRTIFRGANLQDVKVGTVDDYQGQEGKVIFVSTTVSRRYGFTDFSGDAAAVNFIGSPQRFNVALSRAQHLLVVVGDPWVLNMDRCVRVHFARKLPRALVRGALKPPFFVLQMLGDSASVLRRQWRVQGMPAAAVAHAPGAAFAVK